MEQPFLGPEITPENFQVLDQSFGHAFSLIDFGTQNQSFTATFSNKVKWHITIRGLDSKAVKRISGTSLSLDPGNSLWDGGADSAHFFKTGEKCVASLTFFNSNLFLTDTFSIQKEKQYEGFLIDDFETGTSNKAGFDSSYSDIGDANIVINFRDPANKVQGNSSLLLSGTDSNSDYWIGGVKTSASALFQKTGSINANMLYINATVFGTGNNNAGLAIKFFEDDNSSGSYEPANDDAFTYLLKVDWKGWKRIAIPYSGFADDNTATGNNMAEPPHMLSLNLTLVAYSPAQPASLNADFIILTNSSPLPGSTLK